MESLVLTLVLSGTAAAAFFLLRARRTRIRFPIATLVVAALTLAVSATAELVDPLLDLFSRNEDALLAGEWWRVLSALLVQDGGWFGTISNTISLLIVGTLTESLVPRSVWLLVYAVSGLVSEVAAYTVMPNQGFAGNSVAILGLAGLASVVVLIRGRGISRIPALITVALGIGLLGVGNLHGVGFCVGALAGIVEGILSNRRVASRPPGGS